MSADSESDARIRALLAELGSGPEGESIPPSVAARLDDTLARLVAERGTAGEPADQPQLPPVDPSEPGPGNVLPLRRRWAARATAAAAAVIVLGAGGVTAANLWAGGGASSDSTAESAGGATAKETAEDPDGDFGGDTSLPGSSEADENREGLSGADQAARAIPRVSSSTFAADVTALVGRARSPLATPDPAGPTPSPQVEGLSCRGPALAERSTRRLVVYDGTLAVLVVSPRRGGRQLVEAWTCEGTNRLDAARITP